MNLLTEHVPLYLHIIFAFLSLIILGYSLIKDDSRYLFLLLVVNIFGNGPQVLGYYFYDEFFTLFLTALFLLLHIRKKGFKEIRKICSKKYTILIVFFSIFLSIQAFNGIILNDDIRIFRWLIFYLGLVPIYFSIALSFKTSKVNTNSFIFLILIYLVLYLIIGIYFEIFYENRFYAQINFWSGTSYAFFPVLLLYISMFKNIKATKATKASNLTNYIIIAFLIFLGMFFDSRLIQVSLLIWIFSLILTRNYAIFLKMLFIYLFALVFYVSISYTWFEPTYSQIYLSMEEPQENQLSVDEEPQENQLSVDEEPQENQLSVDGEPQENQLSVDGEPQEIQLSVEKNSILGKSAALTKISSITNMTGHIDVNLIKDGLKTYFLHNVVSSFSVFFVSNTSDFTRSLQSLSVRKILSNSKIKNIIFGYGVYRHRVLMAEQMNILLNDNYQVILSQEYHSKIDNTRSDIGNDQSIYRTNAINAFVIDFGIMGLTLFGFIYYFAIREIFKSCRYNFLQISGFIGLSFVWLFFSNILDVYLLYLLLFPNFLNLMIREEI